MKALSWIRARWPYLALLVLIDLPLLLMAAFMAVRVGMFDQSEDGLSTDQLQVFMVFIGGALATSATVIGALLTDGHNRREERRLALDTVTRTLQYLPQGQKESVAGALATMVLLGEQSIAMRVLLPAWDRGLVDDATATWLVGQVLLGANKDESAAREAAAILVLQADHLTDPDRPGSWSFPSCVDRWDPTWPVGAQRDLLRAMAKVVLSREPTWWSTRPPAWFVSDLGECLRSATDDSVKDCAALLLAPLLDTWPAQVHRSIGAGLVGEVHARVRRVAADPEVRGSKFGRLSENLRIWAEGEGGVERNHDEAAKGRHRETITAGPVS